MEQIHNHSEPSHESSEHLIILCRDNGSRTETLSRGDQEDITDESAQNERVGQNRQKLEK